MDGPTDDKLKVLLDSFEANHPIEGRTFKAILRSTPELAERVKRAIDGGMVSSFDGHPLSGTGAYVTDIHDHSIGKILLPMDALAPSRDPEIDAKSRNLVRLVLGHEIGHALNKAEIDRTNMAFSRDVDAIARSTSPHDYNRLLVSHALEQRTREATDEISGVNSLASYIRHTHHHANLRMLMRAHPEMQAYIEIDSSQTPPVYRGRGGLHFDQNLHIDPADPRNVKAMVKLFYDARGYPQTYGARALQQIALAEDLAQQVQPSRPRPDVYVDLQQLGIDPSLIPPAQLPQNVHDGHAPPPALPTPPNAPQPLPAPIPLQMSAPTSPTASAAIAPDLQLAARLRPGLVAAEQALGKPWDDTSERMLASLSVLARRSGFDEHASLAVAFNLPTASEPGGTRVFLSRSGPGASPDPYANRASMSVEQAIATPVPESLEQLRMLATERTAASVATDPAHSIAPPAPTIAR